MFKDILDRIRCKLKCCFTSECMAKELLEKEKRDEIAAKLKVLD